MKKKILLALVLPIFLLAIFAGAALAKNKSYNNDASVALPVDGGSQTPVGNFASTPVMYEGDKGACDNINPQVQVYEVAQWGSTYYDYQKNGSMGRMIAIGPGGYRHMLFHETRGPYNNTTYPRYVTYNCEDPANNWLGATRIDGGVNKNSGYANIAVTHDGRELAIFHRGAAGGCTWYSSLMPGDVGWICQGYFSNIYDLPDLIEGTPAAQNGMWPKHTVVYRADVDTDYIHIVVTQNSPIAGDDQSLGYERCVFQGDNLICRSRLATGPVSYTVVPNVQGSPTLNKIGVFDTVKCIVAIPVHSPVSEKVAIVYTKHRSDTQYNNDVYYIESLVNGDDWLDGTHWGPTLVKHNITQYPPLGTERAYTDVAACYDYNDSLHIVWTGCVYDSVADTHDPNVAYLNHWSQSTGKVLIAPGQWENTQPGAWNRNISKMSISAKDPVYHPGGTPDSVYLFVTWTQFNPGDTSAGGMGNGDIYGVVSNDGGLTWTPGYNLTNTPTPGCTPGNCLSEHWSSMAENMYGGQEHIEYVCDREAGDIIQTDRPWTDNPMMYIRVAQLPFETHCGITYSIVDPPSWTEPPIKVPPSGTRGFSFTVTGIYNLGGNYSVASNNPAVAITTNPAGFLSPNQTKTVGGLITCSGEAFINACIYVRGCIGTADEHTDTLPLYAVCDSNDYYECKRAPNTHFQQDNGICSLWVCVNTSQEVYDFRVRDDQGRPQRVIYSAGVIVATTSGSDTVIGRQEDNFTRTGARDTIRVVRGYDYVETACDIQKTYVEKTYIWYPPVIPQHPNPKWWWININKQIIFFLNRPGYTCPEWKKEQVIKHVWITWGRPPMWWPNPGTYAGHEDIYFGVFADPDAPSDTGCGSCNTAGWDDTRQIMWQHGRYAGQHPEYDDYYVGLALTDTSGAVVNPYAAKDVRNDTFIYPSQGWRDDQLFQLASIPGDSIQDPDSVKDRSMVLTAYKIPAGTDTTFQREFILIEAMIRGYPGTGLQQLQAHIDQTRGTLIPELKSQGALSKRFPICGDVTGDGIVDASDIIYLLNYVFMPGSPKPVWPINRADVNNDNVIDSSDVRTLINYYFACGRLECSGGIPAPPPSFRPPYLKANSDNQRVYLTWNNCPGYDSLYLYCETDTLVLLEVLPGTDTSYSYTPDTSGVYCYYLRAKRGDTLTGYSGSACASFTTGSFLDQPSVITWSDSSLLQFQVLNCYTPGSYTPPIPGQCDPGFFWDEDDSLCRQDCASGYEWINSINQCCQSGKSSEDLLTGWSWGIPKWEPVTDAKGWGTNLQDQYYQDNICTRPLLGASVRVPENGGTQIRIYHWYRTADENDRLCVLARDIDGQVPETFLFPSDPRDLGLATYAPDDGDNTCQKNMPGFAIGLGPDDPNRIRESRFDIPRAFDGKVIELRFVLGSDGAGHEGSGHSYTGWFISRFEYAGTDQHRGDCNGDGGVDASDLVYLLNYLFIKGPDPASLGDAGSAGDVTCDGDIDAEDLVYLLNYLFIDGPPPPCAP